MNNKLNIVLLIIYIILIPASALSQPQQPSAVDNSVQRAIEVADQKQKEAQQKQAMIADYYNKGKASYQVRRYDEAKGYFEKILDIDPSYEPAKLYLEGAIIHLELGEKTESINRIKLQMADIIAEYDKRRELVDNLAVKYFLEQAQQKCQIGDYKAAEEFYNLCYKINPYSKDKIEWFVKATHDLARLSQELDEHSRRIEELSVFEP